MEITTQMIKELREQCGAGIMDCRGALVSTKGDIEGKGAYKSAEKS